MFDKDKMRMLRLEKRITQTQLAEAIGISQPYLNNFEVGRYVPSLEHMEKIAEVLGCSAKDLIIEKAKEDHNA